MPCLEVLAAFHANNQWCGEAPSPRSKWNAMRRDAFESSRPGPSNAPQRIANHALLDERSATDWRD
ncbi:hypothetical protein RSAG8_07227, partial [Rhizoctonia solani AG-8 WAC10335]